MKKFKMKTAHGLLKNRPLCFAPILVVFFFLTIAETIGAEISRAELTEPRALPVNTPLRITSESDSILYSDISTDGKKLIYTKQSEGSLDLWIRSADPSVIILPEKVTSDRSDEFYPVISPDGASIAYVGTAHDSKGDIYLLDITNKYSDPLRLTGRETMDSAPAFSPDGKTLFFHRSASAGERPHIVSLDLTQEGRKPVIIDTGGDASFPSPSPDGKKIAFVSFRDDNRGDILIFEPEKDDVRFATRGSAADIYPAWSNDGEYIYFSRFTIDTNGDGTVDGNDNAAIYRIKSNLENRRAYPVTSHNYSSIHPRATLGKLYFLSNSNGVYNMSLLPAEGEIPLLDSASRQYALAKEISGRIPVNPFLTITAFSKVMESFPQDKTFSAKSAYLTGTLYLKTGIPDQAETSFQTVVNQYGEVMPEGALARLELSLISIKEALSKKTEADKRMNILERGITELDELGKSFPAIKARTLVEVAGLYMNYGKGVSSIIKAIDILDRVIEAFPENRKETADAMLLRARAYARTGRPSGVYPAYLAVIDNYPDLQEQSVAALSGILNISMADFDAANFDDKIMALRRIDEENSKTRPRLSAAALNRIGDLYYEADEWARAKSAFREVMKRFSGDDYSKAAAALALAEILYMEERFRQAIDLYERELKIRPEEDRIYRLARQGYIRKSIEGGERFYRFGEVASARKIFKELMDYDNSIVEAHRGYIKCAVAQGEADKVLVGYRSKLAESPNDPVVLYATALSLTYTGNRESLIESGEMLVRAIKAQGRIEYFHQTYGYVLEVLETVYKEPGNIEKSLEAYKKAYFLNDHKANPLNAANLLLNIGNGYYLLGRYVTALEYYKKRLGTGVAFEEREREIIFYRRFGASAFQARQPDTAIKGYEKAISLIRESMDPTRVSESFDTLMIYIRENVLGPLVSNAEYDEDIADISERESHINKRLFHLNSMKIHKIPGSPWDSYKEGIEDLLSEQEVITEDLLSLYERNGRQVIPVYEAKRTITFLSSKVIEALNDPERLVILEAEMTDRLGLAYQEAGNWAKAMEAFEKAYKLNKRLALNYNLAGNMRSSAYNAYMLAGTMWGDKRREMLNRAGEGFSEVIDLANKFGTAGRKEKDTGKGSALINIRLGLSLDEVGSTKAAYGFDEDQEIRLAETFIAKIKSELGRHGEALDTVRVQLADYPSDKPVRPADLYGVSLLYHRAGHLSVSEGDLLQAFQYYKESADISFTMKNSISLIMNVTNMARLLSLFPPDHRNMEKFITIVRETDKKTSALLDADPVPMAPFFHNTMGVHYSKIADSIDSSSMRAKVLAMNALHAAVSHFDRGLEYFTETDSRKETAFKATLSLNMANTARLLGEAGQERIWLNKALSLAEEGILPDLKWRALVKLGRFDDALDILESVTLLRAGCSQGEILSLFSGLVNEILDESGYEDAFNMIEQLSELERVHALLPFIMGEISENELLLYKKIYPHIVKIKEIKERISSADSGQVEFLKRRLGNEEEILTLKTGPAGENLRFLNTLTDEREIQDPMITLIALALEAEDRAERIVREDVPEKRETLVNEYIAVMKQYNEAVNNLRSENGEKPHWTTPTFRPEPVELIDIIETIEDNDVVARIFDISDKKRLLFTLTPDGVTFNIYSHLEEPDIPQEGKVYIINENPLKFHRPGDFAYAFSATHLYRSLNARKPFKNSLVAFSTAPVGLEGYRVTAIAGDAGLKKIKESLTDSDTFLMQGDIGMFYRVPARPGEIMRRYPGVDTGDEVIPLTSLMDSLSSQSLTLLLKPNLKDPYITGHLLSIAGCPTILFPVKGRRDSAFPGTFLTKYLSSSASETLTITERESGEEWMLLGYRGMTPEESVEYAGRRFSLYSKEGQRNFKAGEYRDALYNFEKAATTAGEIEKLRKYLPVLYEYARECAARIDDYGKSARYASLLVRELEKSRPDSEKHADALLRLGIILAKTDKYGEAIPRLEESLEIMANLELEENQVKALMNTGIILENAVEYDTAMNRFRAAADLSESLDLRELLAMQHMNLGRIKDLRLSDFAGAKIHYRKALEIYKSLENTKDRSQALLDIGRCYRFLGNFKEAESHYAKAMELIGDNEAALLFTAKITMERANNAWFQGRYQEAFELQREVLHIAEQKDSSVLKTMALNTSGLIWWTLGDNDKALDDLSKALSTARDLESGSHEISTTYNNTGLIYRETGDYEKALHYFDKALEIDKRLKSKWAIAYDLRNKGLTLLRAGMAEQALPLFEEALAITRETGNRINEAKTLTGLAETLKILGNDTRALDICDKALDLSLSMSLRDTAWRALLGKAEIFIKRGRTKEAARILRRAMGIIEEMRADISVNKLRDGFLNNKLIVYETLISLLVNEGDIGGAFDISERSRARNFIDLLGNHRLDLHNKHEGELYDRQINLRAVIREYEELIASSSDDPAITVYKKELTNLYKDYRDLMLEIEIKNPELSALVSVNPPGYNEIQGLMEPQTALISYYLLPEEVLIWLLRDKSIDLFRVPVDREALAGEILDYRRMTQNLEPVRTTSQSLYKLLIEPVEEKLNRTEYLAITPHGFLHYLSFATLYDGNRYLLEKYPLFYLPGAGMLEYSINKRKKEKNTNVLAIGNPDLGDPALDLPFSEYEVGSIKWNFDNITILTGERATEGDVKKNISEFGVIHLASHGEFNSVNPLFSAIKLAGDRETDGDLEAEEVFGLHIDADIVLLSACQTGLGKVTKGDDVIGLNRAFFYAGAHAVISSLWRVSDVSTALLVKQFYRQYRTKNKALSLRSAALHVKNRYPHPGYWGAFVLSGDYY